MTDAELDAAVAACVDGPAGATQGHLDALRALAALTTKEQREAAAWRLKEMASSGDPDLIAAAWWARFLSRARIVPIIPVSEGEGDGTDG